MKNIADCFGDRDKLIPLFITCFVGGGGCKNMSVKEWLNITDSG